MVDTKRMYFIIALSMMIATITSDLNAKNPTTKWTSFNRALWQSNAKDVSAPVDAACRRLLTQAGVKNVESITILAGSRNSGKVDMGPLLTIDEDYFNKLEYEQQRAFIGHEAIHIKNNHLPKAALTYFGLCYVWWNYTGKKISTIYQKNVDSLHNQKVKNVLSSWPAQLLVTGLSFGACVLTPLVALSWKFELEATREGTKALNCKAGALSWLEDIQRSWEHYPSETAWERTKTNFRYYFLNRLSHPPLSWHIAEVKKLP